MRLSVWPGIIGIAVAAPIRPAGGQDKLSLPGIEAALDTVMATMPTDIPEGFVAAAPGLYLSQAEPYSEGTMLREGRLDGHWLDSLVKTRHLAGTCKARAFTCDHPMAGYLITVWRPYQAGPLLLVPIELAAVTIKQAFLRTPASSQPGGSRSRPEDRLTVTTSYSYTITVGLSTDSTGHSRVVSCHRGGSLVAP